MNLVLFEPDEINRPLPLADERARHLLTTLRRHAGDGFDAGVTDGRRGRAVIREITSDSLRLDFEAGATLPPLSPTHVLVALPRPQTARDILRDATTLGATALHFVATERSDPNYRHSSLWSSGEWRRHVLAGAAQGFDPRLPSVDWMGSLAELNLPTGAKRLALDNYEATSPLANVQAAADEPVVLAIGPERGWGPQDRQILRSQGFAFTHLGPRVLRVETAVIAALTLLNARRAPA